MQLQPPTTTPPYSNSTSWAASSSPERRRPERRRPGPLPCLFPRIAAAAPASMDDFAAFATTPGHSPPFSTVSGKNFQGRLAPGPPPPGFIHCCPDQVYFFPHFFDPRPTLLMHHPSLPFAVTMAFVGMVSAVISLGCSSKALTLQFLLGQGLATPTGAPKTSTFLSS